MRKFVVLTVLALSFLVVSSADSKGCDPVVGLGFVRPVVFSSFQPVVLGTPVVPVGFSSTNIRIGPLGRLREFNQVRGVSSTNLRIGPLGRLREFNQVGR